ncbi:MAG: hypothetical protein ACI86M_003704 [Saprospiraceae bacterium]|jgi:hypothetical protein
MKNNKIQIERIIHKLSKARAIDEGLIVFGASKHKYKIRKPAKVDEVEEFEKLYKLLLPSCYRSFLLNIGNGGESYASSAAGPFLGIYPLSKNVDELLYEDTENRLNRDCILSPKMSDQEWIDLVKDVEKESTDNEFYEKLAKIYGGILPIGSQGCTYLHGLILNGEYKGRVVNLDIDRQKPKFTFENNFLDWYERWLDEVIDGTLRQNGPTWFGYSKGGNAKILFEEYLNAKNIEDKEFLFASLIQKANLPEDLIQNIERKLQENKGDVEMLSLLTKFDYNKSQSYLQNLSITNFKGTLEIVFSYALQHSDNWIDSIKSNINLIKSNETYRYCRKILENSNIEYGDIILPLLSTDDINLKCSILNTLGNLSYKLKYLSQFKLALGDSDKLVNRYALGALYNVNDDSLRPYYNSLFLKEYNLDDISEKRTYEQLLRNIKFMDESLDINQYELEKESSEELRINSKTKVESRKSLISRLFNRKKNHR